MLTGAAILVACTNEAPKQKKRGPSSPGADYYAGDWPEEDPPIEPNKVNLNSGAFGAAERPSGNGGGSSGTIGKGDGGIDGGGPKEYCDGPLAAGDLGIVEIMITSRSGSGDTGEWVEIQSTRDCWLKLEGLTVESPRGTLAANVASVTELELAPHGTFLVADSADPAKNNGLPGAVVAWNATDVLKNDGDTLKITAGSVEIDSVTYPAFTNLVPGRTLAFPSDCSWTKRSDWTRWSLTFDEFATGFKGTPNKVNTDVTCF